MDEGGERNAVDDARKLFHKPCMCDPVESEAAGFWGLTGAPTFTGHNETNSAL